jgi:hypothetical protein
VKSDLTTWRVKSDIPIKENNMADKPDTKQPQPIQINTVDEISRGRYSNLMLVAHSPEEFIIDWLLNAPNGPHLVSRIILSPSNVKRAIEALTINLKQYEDKFGTVKVIDPGEQKVH